MTPMLSPKEMARILNVGYRKILDMIILGELKAYKIGGVLRISEKEIYRYLDSVKVETVLIKPKL